MKNYNNIETSLSEKIVAEKNIGGGSIANSSLVETDKGNKYFLKSYVGVNKSILSNEANGLKELRKAEAIKIPQIIYVDETYLLLEFIETGNKKKKFSENFGRSFAQLHKYTAKDFGFFENNFIGATPQKNLPLSQNWEEFYWENRLLFQIKIAEKKNRIDKSFIKEFVNLEKKYPNIMGSTKELPSLLHGDLWSGNYLISIYGEPVLIDPAVYYGSREADLGMTHLFGGFDKDFYKAYNEAYPLEDDYQYRIDIYKLYHVLNHLNLFGASYYSQALSIIKSYLR